MSGGMLESFRQIDEKLEGVKRVMLLTDGLANRGVSDREGLIDLVKKRDSTCTLSTFGYGNNCDQELLADLAKEGNGNYYYIGDSKDVKDVFARELGGVLSCMAQNIAMKVSPNKGNKVLEVLNDYTVDDKKGVATIRAEDIYAGETKDVLVKMKVKTPGGKAKDRPFSVARIEVTFDDLRLKKKVTENLNFKVEFVKAEEADKDTILAVAEKVAMLTAAKAQVEAVQYANRGEFRAAKRVIGAGLDMLRVAADRGSVSASSMSSSVSSSTSSMSSEAYSEKFGQELRNANLGMLKTRSTGKGYEGLIGTKAQADMGDKFKDTSTKPEAQAPKKTPKTQKKGGGFGKQRSRK
jgi:Ca-activated chloride channel family protein